jgi:hypothetical protein
MAEVDRVKRTAKDSNVHSRTRKKILLMTDLHKEDIDDIFWSRVPTL